MSSGSSGAGGSIGGNFASFVFTEAGRRILDQEGLSLYQIGWQLALSHRDRANVAARFRDQEDRSRLSLHPSYTERLDKAVKARRDLLDKLATPEGRAAWIKERREDMRSAEAKFAKIADDQVRRMQSLIDELEAWKAPEALSALRQDLISDARDWRPPCGPSYRAWTSIDDALVDHDLDQHDRTARLYARELEQEKETVARLNEWLLAMRVAFGPEPEGYWES